MTPAESVPTRRPVVRRGAIGDNPRRIASTGGATIVNDQDILAHAARIVDKETAATAAVGANLGPAFVAAVRMLAGTGGRVAVTGIGKAGLVGNKIAATLSSTGTPAYTLHPAEAVHGDLGMVCPDDVALALSNSGQTEELARALTALRQIGCRIVLVTGRAQSRCASLSDVVVCYGHVEEACPLGLAPSSSTTAMLVMGDALALTVLKLKDFTREQYAGFHPGGELGRSLMKVEEIMRKPPACPMAREDGTIADYNRAIRTAGESSPLRGSGAVAVLDAGGRLVGFFTDGDLRRLIERQSNPVACKLADVMTRNPRTARVGEYVVDAAKRMRAGRIDELPVVDDGGRCVGMIDIQDLFTAGFSVFDAD